jgi:exosome complex RNA-binding protein Csl4
MTLRNHKEYAAFQYESHMTNECPYVLGDVVINEENEVGVIIQIHDDNEYRTDQFGNTHISQVRMATNEEIQKFRPNILNEGFNKGNLW